METQLSKCYITMVNWLDVCLIMRTLMTMVKKMLQSCKSCRLLLMKGRVGADQGIGHFTEMDTTGNSVADYGIITPGLYDTVARFSIDYKFPEFDHLPLLISIKYHLDLDENVPQIMSDRWVPYEKYKRSHDSIQTFKSVLPDFQSQIYYHDALNQIISMTLCNDLAEALKLLKSTGCRSIFLVRSGSVNRITAINQPGMTLSK